MTIVLGPPHFPPPLSRQEGTLPPPRVSMSHTHFAKGDQVEVNRPGNTSTGPYYPATVLRPVAKDKSHMIVQYQTLTTPNAVPPKPLTEIVQFRNVKPMPPPTELHQYFKVGDDVDAYVDKGWSRGTVRDILENSMYVVELNGQEFECEQCSLRVHREWDDGSWFPPFYHEENSSRMVKARKLTLKFKCSEKVLNARFENGDVVEVTSDEKGYEGAWYTAKIINYLGNDKFLVEYQHLVTDDGTELLREEAYASYIRPYPPRLPSVVQFKVLQRVDALYNDGWWEGIISRVLGGSKYVVYFSTTNEELELNHSDLRPHQYWSNGRWIHAYM